MKEEIVYCEGEEVKFEYDENVRESDNKEDVSEEEVMHYGYFTVVRLKKTYYVPGKNEGENDRRLVVQGVGISKQSPEDKQDKDLGIRIAKGRALKAIKTKLSGKKIHHHYMS